MSPRFAATAIDLSTLPKPQLVDTIDYETILAAQKADVIARFAAAGITFDTTVLESETISIVLEATAYRETILRSLVNAKALETLLAYADGLDLDHIGVRFGCLRNPGVGVTSPRGNVLTYPQDWENDTLYRKRIQLAPDAYSNAGTPRAYEYHVLTAGGPYGIVDVNVISPEPGRVDCVCLSVDGVPSDTAIGVVYQRLMQRDVKPLTDDVRVVKTTIVPYVVQALLRVPSGPDPALLRNTAITSGKAYAATRYQVGAIHYWSAINASLQIPNVLNVIMKSPLVDIIPGDYGTAVPQFDITSEVAPNG